MVDLNLPSHKFNIIQGPKGAQVFCVVRKKYVFLTPEEWVRQHYLLYLKETFLYPLTLMKLEMKLTINELTRRPDIVLFNRTGDPKLIVECKAPDVKITQEAFEQISQYNLKLKVPFLSVTNGLHHYHCKVNLSAKTVNFIPSLPFYEAL